MSLKLTLLFLALSTAAFGQDLYSYSQVSIVGANALDAASSWDRPELNPVLGPRFGTSSLLIKGAIVGGFLGIETLLVRHHHEWRRKLAWINFGAAGITTGTAVRNWRLR